MNPLNGSLKPFSYLFYLKTMRDYKETVWLVACRGEVALVSEGRLQLISKGEQITECG